MGGRKLPTNPTTERPKPPEGPPDSFGINSALLSAIQGLLEIYDCVDGRVWTTASKRRALDAAHEAVKLALGEKE